MRAPLPLSFAYAFAFGRPFELLFEIRQACMKRFFWPLEYRWHRWTRGFSQEDFEKQKKNQLQE
jgi:hypothetical protein